MPEKLLSCLHSHPDLHDLRVIKKRRDQVAGWDIYSYMSRKSKTNNICSIVIAHLLGGTADVEIRVSITIEKLGRFDH